MSTFNKSEGFFLLVMRGGCPFTKKMKNAEKFGAQAIIISDFSEEQESNNEDKLIAVDNTERGVYQPHIPSFEISYDDSSLLYERIKLGEVVVLRAVVDNTNEWNSVEVDLWYSSSLDLGERISDELSAISLSYQNNHRTQPNVFTPRIATYSCTNCDIDFTEKNCVSNGAYCAYTPSFYQEYELDKDPNFTMTGRDVII